jgi:hypothetical protein
MEHETVQKTSRFSKLKVGLAAVALGALLVVPAGAQDTEDMSVTITGGTLDVTLTEEAGLTGVNYSHTAQDTQGAVTVGVNDARGTEDGWGVTLEAEAFVGEVETNTIAASNFQITGQGSVTDASGLNNEGDVSQVEFTEPSDLETAVPIASAASGGGSGDFSWVSNLNLDVPAGQNADTYTSTLTLTSTEAP